MRDDPVRLRDDPQRASLLRDDLRAVAAATPAGLDLPAGLAKLVGSMHGADSASGSGPTTTAGAAASPAASGIVWIAGIAGFAGLVVAALALPAREAAEPVRRSAPERGSHAPVEQAVAPSAPVAAARETTPSPELPLPQTKLATAAPRPHRHATPSVAEAGEASGPDPVTREIELVSLARTKLAGDPAAALAAVETARAESPNGALAEERDALAILALHALGRRVEARRRATDYLLRWPSGTQSTRIRRVLDEGDDR